ncbi:phosphatidate cytidylyltransferase [Halanaerobium saccharolyticum]|uniref:Phosphatidate cytidylyltransferase n=1 Tax=Halanaerobium saccharolyticum TaxID=43595 RepID=A0A4R7Z6H8_9FIRM|nr:phosphatidate cytidylyltransferase [Halanaerobium saccharolyticum]RAK11120.1 phosphatidate cytidylyltransferase [Halanaerobium saccharolyticum]TDW06971.1 phosphatidate cytidylyltransferase [Halanaerobium saccharolyticum]TDX63736.1 phosphatidate cytidylyltransferase [Halanaerobium saccharolyticum]
MMVIIVLKKRIISAIIGILLLIFLVFAGSLPFFITVSIITILAVREYSRMLKVKSKLLGSILAASAVLIVFNVYLISNNYNYLPSGIIFFIITFILYLYNLYNYREEEFIKNLSHQLFSVIYIGGGLSFAVFLRDINRGIFINTSALWLVLIATWLTDSGAYFVGKKFGKKAMAPVISPNKTVAGAVGGIFTTAIFIIFVSIFLEVFNIYYFIFAFLFPAVAIMGDLFESCIKRSFKVKDTGTIIPGHGGILDRFDSFIFTAPFTYYFIILLLG